MPTDTREFLWNVGHGALLPMYIVFAIASLIFLYAFYRRWRVYRLGQRLNRLDQPIRRVIRYLERAYAQLRVLLVRLPGIAHAFLFWGMVILFIATVIITIQVDFTQPLFHWTFWKGIFYDYYSVFTDLAGVVAFGMLVVFGIRRYILRPAGLPQSWDDKLIFALLTIILLTGFILEGSRNGRHGDPGQPPVGCLFTGRLVGRPAPFTAWRSNSAEFAPVHLVGSYGPRYGFHRSHSLYQAAPYVDHPRQLFSGRLYARKVLWLRSIWKPLTWTITALPR